METVRIVGIAAVTAAAIFLMICSCREAEYNAPEFPVEREAEWEIVSDEMYVKLVYDMWEHKSYLLVPLYDVKAGHNLWIFDKNSGEKVWSGIMDGRGPGETVGGIRNTYFNEGVLTYYDDLKGSILRYNVDSLLAGSFVFREESYASPLWARTMVEFGENRLFVRIAGPKSQDLNTVSRFELVGKSGDTLDKYGFSPIEDRWERFYVYGNCCYSASPDKRRLAVGTSMGVILETYAVEADSLKQKAVKFFYEPDIEVSPGGYDYNENTVLGFNDIYAEADRLYTVYDGEINPFWNDGERPTFTKIAVFDWEGNPIELIRTDYSIDKICFSEAENTIYAAVKDHDGIMYLAKMEL